MKLVKAKILSNDEIAADYSIIKIESPEISSIARPGQFAHIQCADAKEIILRRPFSFYKIEGNIASFLYRITGKGTSFLKMRSQGEDISVLGPLGRGFWFANNGKKKIIIAGGVGIAPFPFFVREMIHRAKIKPEDIIVIYGAKKKERLVGLDEFRSTSLYLVTEDGDEGARGEVIDLARDLLEKGEIKDGDYFTCGPEKMMQKVSLVLKEYGKRVQVLLEERMGCAVGACLGCVKKVAGDYLRVCKDGPVFWGDEVEW